MLILPISLIATNQARRLSSSALIFSNFWIVGPSHPHSHSHPRLHGDHHHHGQDGGRPNRPQKYTPTEFDMDKLRSTFKQLVRDWSEEVGPYAAVTLPVLVISSISRERKNARHVTHPWKMPLSSISPTLALKPGPSLPALLHASPRIDSPFFQA